MRQLVADSLPKETSGALPQMDILEEEVTHGAQFRSTQLVECEVQLQGRAFLPVGANLTLLMYTLRIRKSPRSRCPLPSKRYTLLGLPFALGELLQLKTPKSFNRKVTRQKLFLDLWCFKGETRIWFYGEHQCMLKKGAE
ncbi:hypothetical protein FQA47_009684 [Oryzias melastigma]|uniref:Uncharacterized protein n=1 Tax=Oryzias melastigma TaxID=30732 RepID=A0A834C9U5_ORYME|nr:hypothetical protein FQA47_009684 [Oryzias melastigma]